MKATDVIISGGGIPGFTLALLLVRAGLDVTVCDPVDFPPPEDIKLSGRTAALMEGSLEILDRAGLLEKVTGGAQDLKVLAISDNGKRHDFSSREIGMSRFGQNIQNSMLQAHAAQEFKRVRGGHFIRGSLTNIAADDGKVTATFSNGESCSAQLVVGADGRESFVRKAAGIGVWEHDYGQTALTGVVRHAKPHHSTSTEFHYSGGPFTVVPMKGDMSSFVWMEKTADAQRIAALPKEGIEALFLQKSGGLLGDIELATPVSSFPIKIQKAHKIMGRRMALIAEAAHVLSPIGAQGLNLSLRDIAALYDLIVEAARLGLDCGSNAVLRKYEAARQADIGMRVAGTDMLNRSVATENSFIATIRRLGFRAAADIPPLRAFLVREGLSPGTSFAQAMLSGLETRATVKTSTRAAPAA